jgi:hypothetical protein
MRLVMISLAAMAVATFCLAAMFVQALRTPTRARALYPVTWATTIVTATSTSSPRLASLDFTQVGRRALEAFSNRRHRPSRRPAA